MDRSTLFVWHANTLDFLGLLTQKLPELTDMLLKASDVLITGNRLEINWPKESKVKPRITDFGYIFRNHITNVIQCQDYDWHPIGSMCVECCTSSKLSVFGFRQNVGKLDAELTGKLQVFLFDYVKQLNSQFYRDEMISSDGSSDSDSDPEYIMSCR